MGYYTKFNLSAVDRTTGLWPDTELECEMARALWHLIYAKNYWKPSCFEDCFDEEMKWYDHTSDMIAFSKLYPDYVFVLCGVGEEPDDQWRLFVCNGEAEETIARIVYDEPQNELFRSVLI